jgi:hypothetical protein
MASKIKQIEEQIHKANNTLEILDRNKPTDVIGLKRWTENRGNWRRKLEYEIKKLITLGQLETIIEVSVTINDKKYKSIPKHFKYYFTGISLEDSKTLVKYKLKEIETVTILFKEIPTGVFIYN